MLAKPHRLHHPADFTEVMRRGRRASQPLLTVHALLLDPAGADGSQTPGPATPGPAAARVGLVVGKTVGGSTVRSTVSRRLRHLLADRLRTLPDGVRLVVRAAPAAGVATSAALAADLDAALPTALRRRHERRG